MWPESNQHQIIRLWKALWKKTLTTIRPSFSNGVVPISIASRVGDEIYEELLRRRTKYDSKRGASFRTYVYRHSYPEIMRRVSKILDEYFQEPIFVSLEEIDHYSPEYAKYFASPEESVDIQYERAEMLAFLSELLEEMREKDFERYKLYNLALRFDVPVAELAKEYSLSRSTVYRIIKSTSDTLRKRLREHFGDDD